MLETSAGCCRCDAYALTCLITAPLGNRAQSGHATDEHEAAERAMSGHPLTVRLVQGPEGLGQLVGHRKWSGQLQQDGRSHRAREAWPASAQEQHAPGGGGGALGRRAEDVDGRWQSPAALLPHFCCLQALATGPTRLYATKEQHRALPRASTSVAAHCALARAGSPLPRSAALVQWLKVNGTYSRGWANVNGPCSLASGAPASAGGAHAHARS